MTQTANQPKRESLLLNLLLNIIIPTVILTKFSGDNYLGTKWSIVIALAFPILYGLNDFRRTGKLNLFSALGVISIFLTGGISLLELDPKYIAFKEAGIPALFGLATLISLKTRYPLVRTFLYNDKILQIDKVAQALAREGTEVEFNAALKNASYLVAMSFFLSSALNYGLAKYLLVSPPGTEQFNAELGKMTALSFPVIAIPATAVMMFALFYLFKKIKVLTHLDLDDILIHQ
ncbi:MAG: MFS transporter [Gammaproteobacteria bacterium]|uniref:VC0807 family protein n=1 Tax=Pseudomaricurvus alcaniphilus TaxID=1166482 RepID=UPI00140E379D|nr:VC0807 family protein [Pseudomaricurvus alcaniphilus]MBR9912050.1 MFS transporter [Gammaproteobacteria bacterium]NHN37472.1 MFS transporter [Pseudomaricurvus alcaniphilus]